MEFSMLELALLRNTMRREMISQSEILDTYRHANANGDPGITKVDIMLQQELVDDLSGIVRKIKNEMEELRRANKLKRLSADQSAE